MWSARLDETQARIKISRRNINNLRYADDTALMAENEEELKSFLMRVKEETAKAGLKLSIQKTKIMANRREKWKQWQTFFSWTLKSLKTMTAAMKIKDGCLLLGRKAMTKLDSILKSRDTRCFQTVVLKKTLESPFNCKEIKAVNPKGNQSWIFIEKTDAEAEAPILWPSDEKSQLTGEDPDAGKDWRQEEEETIENEMVGWHHSRDMSLRKFQYMVKDREVSHAAVHGVAKSQTWLSDWTTAEEKSISHCWWSTEGEIKWRGAPGSFRRFAFPVPCHFPWSTSGFQS